MQIAELTDAGAKRRALEQIIETLPDWFAQPAANAAYIDAAADRIVFACRNEAAVLGLVALKSHFARTAEIWWLGVKPDLHRKGIGTQLMQAAEAWARRNGHAHLAVMTISPRSDDAGYAATRRFYEACGFAPLVEFDEDDPMNPMMWMIKPVA